MFGIECISTILASNPGYILLQRLRLMGPNFGLSRWIITFFRRPVFFLAFSFHNIHCVNVLSLNLTFHTIYLRCTTVWCACLSVNVQHRFKRSILLICYIVNKNGKEWTYSAASLLLILGEYETHRSTCKTYQNINLMKFSPFIQVSGIFDQCFFFSTPHWFNCSWVLWCAGNFTH